MSRSDVAIERGSESLLRTIQYELVATALNPPENDAADEHIGRVPVHAVCNELMSSAPDLSKRTVPFSAAADLMSSSFTMNSYPQPSIHLRELYPLNAAVYLLFLLYVMS